MRLSIMRISTRAPSCRTCWRSASFETTVLAAWRIAFKLKARLIGWQEPIGARCHGILLLGCHILRQPFGDIGAMPANGLAAMSAPLRKSSASGQTQQQPARSTSQA